MSDERFIELVNLFLDEEIGREEKAELQAELNRQPNRRREFESRCRLYRAMRFALLSPEERARLEARDREIAASYRRSHFKVRMVTLGLAASVVICTGLTVGYIVTETEHYVDSHELAQESTLYTFPDQHARYGELSSSNTQNPYSGSVAAQLRLLGLRPDIEPNEPELQRVDLAAQARRQQARMEEIQQLNALRGYSPVTSPSVFRAVAPASPGSSAFDVSLVSYK